MPSRAIQSWLKKRLSQEIAGHLFVGLVCAILGLIALAITLGGILFLFLWLDHALPLAWRQIPYGAREIFWVVLSILSVTGLFLVNPPVDNLEYFFRTYRPSDPSPDPFQTWPKIIFEILLIAPRLLKTALGLFHKSLRLARFDLILGAAILDLLALRGARVSFREITVQFPGLNPAKIFPQFRDLEGVVFLIKEPAGLSLTEELRKEIRALRGPAQAGDPSWSRPTPEPSDPYTAPQDPCCRILGIKSTATLIEARAAYRRLMKAHHPDRVAGLGEDLIALAEERSKEINAAYEEFCARHPKK